MPELLTFGTVHEGAIDPPGAILLAESRDATWVRWPRKIGHAVFGFEPDVFGFGSGKSLRLAGRTAHLLVEAQRCRSPGLDWRVHAVKSPVQPLERELVVGNVVDDHFDGLVVVFRVWNLGVGLAQGVMNLPGDCLLV